MRDVYRAIGRQAGKMAEARRVLQERADPRDLPQLLVDLDVFGAAPLDEQGRRVEPTQGVVRRDARTGRRA